ncbi:hypothetical protein AYI68_g8077, partial [Smittium mucronatum]
MNDQIPSPQVNGDVTDQSISDPTPIQQTQTRPRFPQGAPARPVAPSTQTGFNSRPGTNSPRPIQSPVSAGPRHNPFIPPSRPSNQHRPQSSTRPIIHMPTSLPNNAVPTQFDHGTSALANSN